MSKIVVDQVQKSGGVALTLPTSDGANGQFLQTDGSGNLAFASAPAPIILLPEDSANAIGAVFTSTAQGNVYGSTGQWTSSGAGGTYNNYLIGSNAATTAMAWNMALADGFPNGSSQIAYANNREGEYSRQILYANWNRLGIWRSKNYYDANQTANYSGITWSLLPVRNTTGSAITATFSQYGSYQFSSYGGIGVGLYTPNAATYAATTGGTWSQVYTNNTGGNSQLTYAFSVAVPANTTVVLLSGTTHSYQTTYQFFDVHMWYNLSTAFTTGLVCDLRMLHALYMARSSSNTSSVADPWRIYNAAAAMYGDR